MNTLPPNISLNIEDISFFIIEALQRQKKIGSFGYDLYILDAMRIYLRDVVEVGHSEIDQTLDDIDRKFGNEFLSAAWELCRFGILRPGSKKCRDQEVDGVQGFSLTPYGKNLIGTYDGNHVLPGAYSRFLNMLTPFQELFGNSYFQRAKEATRCYQAQLYLSCCAMSGAASESIVLSLGIRCFGEAATLKIYYGSQGRKKLIDKILINKPSYVKTKFEGLMELLLYWRDESAHGKISHIDSDEAYIALSKLYRLSRFVEENIECLTSDL